MRQLRKFVINVIFIAMVFVIYFLQANFFSWFTISGVMPNVFIIFVLFVGLFAGKSSGTIYGVFIGIILDFLFKTKIGLTSIVLGGIGFLAGVFDKNFSKDSRITIMFMVLGSTVLAEIALYFFNIVFLEGQVEILSFIKILIIEVIYNLILTIIFYPLMQKFGYYIENEYKGNQILTRYF